MGRRRRWGRGRGRSAGDPRGCAPDLGNVERAPCGRRRATSVVQLHMPVASRLPCAGGLLFHGPFRQRADICPHSVRRGQIADSCKRRWPGAFPSRSGLPAMSRRQSNHGTCELSTRTGLRGRMSTGCMSSARSDCRATWAVAQAHPHRTTGGAQTTAAAQTRQRGMPRRDACERKPAAPKNDMPAVDPQAGAGLLRAPSDGSATRAHRPSSATPTGQACSATL